MDEFEQMRLETKDIANNTATRLPLILCIDASYSMLINKRIKNINDGIRTLLMDLKEDVYAVDSVELCIVSFGGREAKTEVAFNTVNRIQFEDIPASGETPLGQAVTFALDRLEERLDTYGDLGIEHYKPWLVIISDGEATDQYQKAAERTKALEEADKLKVFPICLGDHKTSLADFSIYRKIYSLDEFKVRDFFAWLSQSMSAQSKSTQTIGEIRDIEKWIV